MNSTEIELSKANANEIKKARTTKNQLEKDSKIVFVDFSKYNVPQPKEISTKDWVLFGDDNLYLQYLADKFKKSSTHNSLIKMKTRQVSGQGFVIQDSEDHDQQAKIASFMKQNGTYETFDQILRKNSFDLELFGAFCIGVEWSRDFSEIARIYHVDASQIRIGKEDEEGDVNFYYWSKKWSESTKEKYRPKAIATFDPTNKIDHDQLFYVRKYCPDTPYYGVPDYVGALNCIELTYELSNHLLMSVKRGFSPSILINFNDGMPPAEKREQISKMLNQYYAGSDNAGRVMVTFSKDKSSAPDIKPIDANGMNEVYKVLAEFADQQIIQAHGLTSPELAGIAIPGKLGSVDIARAQELFYSQVIQPDQILLEEAYNKILNVNDFTLDIEIKNCQPLSYQMDAQYLGQYLTINEVRKKLGEIPVSDVDRKEIYERNGYSADSSGEQKPESPKNQKTENKK